MRRLLRLGLAATSRLFEPIRPAFELVHRAASVLGNEAGAGGAVVRRRLDAVVRRMSALAERGGAMAAGLAHFAKVYRSYRPGLFHCYDVAGLPRTNNDLEQLFGTVRHCERRCSGRKVGSPGLVVRHGVRLVACVMTKAGEVPAEGLPAEPGRWRELRSRLDGRRESRRQQCRFRRDPAAYLRELEQKATG